MFLRYSLVFVLVFIFASCSSPDKQPLKDAQIQTEIIAKSNGEGETIIEAVLQVKSEKKDVKDIDIELPFTLQAKVGNQTRTLYKTVRQGETIYTTKLPTDSVSEKYYISAAEGDKPQSSNYIILPQPFHITSVPNQDYERNQDIAITWDNSKKDGKIDAGFALTCVGQGKPAVIILRKQISDNGLLNINAAELVQNAKSSIDTSQGCQAMVILSRQTEKSLNPLFGEGSYSLGVQERRTNFFIKASSKSATL